jgi:hypothetical protein
VLSGLPELLPGVPFERLILGRSVGGGVFVDAAWRTGIAVLLVPAGALLFRRRQIAA